jgi:hypothetical protein
MPRSTSARLAVLLFIIPILLTLRSAATAEADCVRTSSGIECWFEGTTTSTSVTEIPPIRYLATMTHPTVGPCWYWSRYPPGIDSFNPANDGDIIITRTTLPRCPASGGGTVIDSSSRAWDVFRAWTLGRPSPRIRPTVGITNLASVLTAPMPAALSHTETLPDGRRLEVRATVEAVVVDWGDGSPPVSYPASTVAGSGATHPYRLKTCPPAYRRDHPSGRNCHPTLAAYPVSVTFRWTGRYRTGTGPWTILGVVPRATTFGYDVDEVVGIPVRP